MNVWISRKDTVAPLQNPENFRNYNMCGIINVALEIGIWGNNYTDVIFINETLPFFCLIINVISTRPIRKITMYNDAWKIAAILQMALSCAF